VDRPFGQTVERTLAVLQDHGIGILTKIDVQVALKEKIAADFRPVSSWPREIREWLIRPFGPRTRSARCFRASGEPPAVDPVDKVAPLANKVRQELRSAIESL